MFLACVGPYVLSAHFVYLCYKLVEKNIRLGVHFAHSRNARVLESGSIDR